jgi:LemA protein
MVVVYAILGTLGLALIYVVGTYNALMRLRQHVRESWSDIDTELKRRYDLIPNLVETVMGYAAHERETLEAVLNARAKAVSSTGGPGSQARDENAFVALLRRLFAVVEAYPELKANQGFVRLQRELTLTEDRIQAARRFYNGNVRDLNTRIHVFPSNLIASLFGIRQEEFFEIEAMARAVPGVQFRARVAPPADTGPAKP